MANSSRSSAASGSDWFAADNDSYASSQASPEIASRPRSSSATASIAGRLSPPRLALTRLALAGCGRPCEPGPRSSFRMNPSVRRLFARCSLRTIRGCLRLHRSRAGVPSGASVRRAKHARELLKEPLRLVVAISRDVDVRRRSSASSNSATGRALDRSDRAVRRRWKLRRLVEERTVVEGRAVAERGIF